MAGTCVEGVDTGFVALGYGKVAVLGVVQGITELLPISSTAHMRLVPALLGWPDPGSAFSAAMQLAALAAVVTYFWADLRWLATGSVTALAGRDWRAPPLRLAVGVVVATVPIAIGGLLLSRTLNACGTPLRSLWVIGAMCLVMGLLLLAAELSTRHRRSLRDVGLLDSLLVGCAQVGALIPGVSRSGSTLTAGLMLGARREEAARMSFLLGVPAIALAGLHELALLRAAHVPLQAWSVLLFGLVVASLSSFAAIWGLMRYLERFTTWPFIVYRLVLGAVILGGVAVAGWT